MNTTIQCWVVRNSAPSVQSGGLERLFVHFTKPTFQYRKEKSCTGDLPFSEPTEKCGVFTDAGWFEKNKKTWVHNLSVGNWLGYDNPLSGFIWSELCKHFNDEPILNWDVLEKTGVVKREDFCLEIMLEIKIGGLINKN